MTSTLLKVMDYTKTGSWRKAGRLPGAGFSLQGASIGSDFCVTGGDNVDIRRKRNVLGIFLEKIYDSH